MNERILVDSNVLLDVITEDKNWLKWSAQQLAKYAENHVLVINPIIYAEISTSFKTIEELETQAALQLFHKEPLPWNAAFLAAKAFLKYKKNRSNRTSPLPDFFIGAHAIEKNMSLLTRDAKRYTSYFPKLKLITPSKNRIN